jgi:hypothetical protein
MQTTVKQKRQDLTGNLPLAVLPLASLFLMYVHGSVTFYSLLLLIGFAGFVMDVISIFTERWRIAAISLIIGVALWAYLWPAMIARL